MDDNRVGLILMLLREGSTRHAIHVFREEAEVSFPVARQSVLALAQRHGIRLRRKPFVSMALLAIASLLVGLMLV